MTGVTPAARAEGTEWVSRVLRGLPNSLEGASSLGWRCWSRSRTGVPRPARPRGENVERSAGVGRPPSFHDAGGGPGGGECGRPARIRAGPSLPQPPGPREAFPAWD